MAKWLAKNSMLTEKGVEILNKLKAGSGKITITKVIAGSGRIDDTKLYSATFISGATKQLVIESKSVRESGSEISVYIENTDFTEPFTLQQIGVYVSHPDYSEEVLYHISQCEADGADTIPIPSETPATLDYSLYLEHGNSEAIELIVSPQGTISSETFNSFKENIKTNGIVSVDDKGNLIDSGKSISELCNPNLLMNPYFPSPVNRRNGYVIPANTPYYSDKEMSVEAGTTGFYTTFTKVNDVYGTVRITNTVYYVPTSTAIKGYVGQGVTVDRWKINEGNGAYALLDNEGVRFGNESFDKGVVRHNTYLTPRDTIGRKFTLSMLTADGRFFTVTTPTPYDGSNNWKLATVEIDGVEFNISSNGSSFFGVQFTLNTNQELNIKAMKLEVGTQQTLAHQDSEEDWVLNEIPNFAEESAKSAQYGFVNDEYLGSTPYGYIEEEVTVQSAELDLVLERIYSSMPNSKMKYVLVYLTDKHPVLGGSTRLMQIFKANSSYGFIKATRYAGNDTGVTIEHTRSRDNGVWTEWAKVYNDHSKPTLAELGAAPAGFGLGDTATEFRDANAITKSGFYVCDLNTPDENWWYGVHIEDGSGNAYQEFSRFIGTNHRVCRHKLVGVWQPWEYIIAPMNKDVEYRTTERYLGKAVIKKVDSSGNILWKTEDETDWRTTSSSSTIAQASVE